MRAALRAFLFALLVASAGCSAFLVDAVDSGGPASETTTTATERPTTADRPATTVAVGPPPGLTTGGLADADSLVSAHADVVANQSVTLDERRVRRYGNESVRWRRNLTLRTAANRTRFLSSFETDDWPVYGASEGRVVTFADGAGVYRHVETPNTSWTAPLRTPTGDPESPASVGLDVARTDDLYVVLTAFAANDSAAVRRSVADPRRYRVESSTVTNRDLLAAHLGLAELRTATLTAVVTAEGLVAEYRLTYAGTENGSAVRGATTLRYSAVGETEVAAPTWYDAVGTQSAGNATVEVREFRPLSLLPNGHVSGDA